MIPTYAQLALLCDELGKPEKSLSYARTGLKWVEHLDNKEAAAFATGILTEMTVKHSKQLTIAILTRKTK